MLAASQFLNKNDKWTDCDQDKDEQIHTTIFLIIQYEIHISFKLKIFLRVL